MCLLVLDFDFLFKKGVLTDYGFGLVVELVEGPLHCVTKIHLLEGAHVFVRPPKGSHLVVGAMMFVLVSHGIEDERGRGVVVAVLWCSLVDHAGRVRLERGLVRDGGHSKRLLIVWQA